MKVYKVTRPDSHGERFGCFYKNADFLDGEFDGAEIGERITVELMEMTEAEFDALGDFTGW